MPRPLYSAVSKCFDFRVGAVTGVPGIVAYLDAQAVEKSATEMLALFNAIVGLMLLFGTVMAFALLFNAMAANTAERSVELGTLRAAGFSHQARDPGLRRARRRGSARPAPGTPHAAAQAAERWGAKVIDRLAADLWAEFPDMTGLSRSNSSAAMAVASTATT